MLADFTAIEKDEKAVIRLAMREMAAIFPPAPAAEQLLKSPIWRDAATVALYHPLPGECDTLPLLNNAWQMGKTVYLPKVIDKKSRVMAFLRCRSLECLRPGSHGIMEPETGEAANCADLLIAPALAYDRRGFRLGYGGGYYDRFLALYPDFAKLRTGLCARWQLLARLPADSWDIPMQAICTEEGIICL